MRIAVSLGQRDVERFKTAFYRYMETRLTRLPDEDATPAISVSADGADIHHGDSLGPNVAEDFLSYWRRSHRPAR